MTELSGLFTYLGIALVFAPIWYYVLKGNYDRYYGQEDRIILGTTFALFWPVSVPFIFLVLVRRGLS